MARINVEKKQDNTARIWGMILAAVILIAAIWLLVTVL